ncbi:hypothetical protein DV735_g173, partial [Chaetothyriales sp. CBS 134920]
MARRKTSPREKPAARAKKTRQAKSAPRRKFRLRDSALNMLPGSYNPAALIPAAHFYMPDYALGSRILTRDQLTAYYPRASILLQEEIAAGNGVKWMRSAAVRGGSNDVTGEAEAGTALVTKRHCTLAGLALEIKEMIFNSTLGDHGGAFMLFDASGYTTTLQGLLALACTSKGFRAEVLEFILGRKHVIAAMHFHTLFRCWSVPYMPVSHAAFIKQINIEIGTLLHLNWEPYISKKCMPNLQKLVVVWERIESQIGNNYQETKEMAEYAALERLGHGLKQIYNRECTYGSPACWIWEIVEGNTCNIVVQFLVQVSIVRYYPTGTMGSLGIPGLPQYLSTQNCLIELSRDAAGKVLDNPHYWKLETITEQKKKAILVLKDFH